MNDKYFTYWSKVRKQGFLVWAIKSTVVMAVAFIVFNILINYPSSDVESVSMYVKANVVQYSLFPCLMLFVN